MDFALLCLDREVSRWNKKYQLDRKIATLLTWFIAAHRPAASATAINRNPHGHHLGSVLGGIRSGRSGA